MKIMRCRNNNQYNLTTTKKKQELEIGVRKEILKNPTKQEIGQNKIK